MIDGYDDNFSTTDRPIYVKPAVTEEKRKMVEMPITLEPYEAYCNRLIKETHKMVKEMHDIVHCKDCQNWEDGYCTREGRHYQYDAESTDYLSFRMDAEDFCSRGERKDE